MAAAASATSLRSETPILVGVVAAVAGFGLEHSLIGAGRAVSLVAALALIAVIVGVSIRVARHAEHLAHRVGDPYGTLILTVSAVLVEVLILAILVLDEGSPTLVRDTIYSAVMLDINGLLGVAAIIGGIRHGEQPYNDNSGKTYTVMILTAMGISMIVPEFVPRESWHYYSVFTIIAMLSFYALFLRNQVGRHSYFFMYAYPREKGEVAEKAEPEGSLVAPVALLVGGVVLIGALAEVMSTFLNVGLEGSGAPVALTAIVVATISASPEILTALRAALANHMQAVVNIALGASLSTVLLTVPVMETIALINGEPFTMSMTPVQTTMVLITLLAAAININDGETNAIEGLTHFVLFVTFIFLSFIGL